MPTQNPKLPNPELEAEIYYLTEKEGGRTGYVKSGYRGQFYYNGRDWDAGQEFVDKEICNPGETVNVRLQTTSPEMHAGQFIVGQTFEIREGAKTVGRGKITKILNPDFHFWDFDTFLKNLPVDCKPYDKGNIDGFITDVEYGLASIEQIDQLNFKKTLGNHHQMLTVECLLKDKNTPVGLLIDKICKSWREEIQFEKAYYKTEFKKFDTGFAFEITFATWHSMFLTGKICVKTN